MTISPRFLLCLCAALCLCFGVVSAQQPTQQRFLRFLGQRSVTTGTLLPTVEPFRAGVPTTASLVFAIMDSEGRVLKDDSTIVFLSLIGQNAADLVNTWEQNFVLSDSCFDVGYNGISISIGCKRSPIPARASAGFTEFSGLRLSGVARDNAVLLCSSATLQSTTVIVSLIGGKTKWLLPEQTKTGVPTVPGRYINDIFSPNGTANILGKISSIEIGKPVVLNQDTADFRYITLRAVDRWKNSATFSTTVSISLIGGTPPTDPFRTSLSGNSATTDSKTGRVVFDKFVIYGVTTNSAGLIFFADEIYSSQYFDSPRNTHLFLSGIEAKETSLLSSSAASPIVTEINIVPGNAVVIAPVIIPDIYGKPDSYWGYTPNRMPSRFTIGKSNADDPRTWFYLQAVDQFGNRVDNGPNAYNGGVAIIHIATPEEGLPRSTTSNFQFSASADPFVRANSQRFAATGTSAVAVNGLYTFNNFTPLGPASSSMTDTVVLTFEDPALKGVNSPFPLVSWLFRPIPPITTATTTFVQTTNVALRSEASGFSLTPNPASDALHITLALPESAPVLVRIEDMLGRTVLRHEEQSAVQGAFATTLDVSRLAQGAYTLHVQSGRGRWAYRVVILR